MSDTRPEAVFSSHTEAAYRQVSVYDCLTLCVCLCMCNTDAITSVSVQETVWISLSHSSPGTLVMSAHQKTQPVLILSGMDPNMFIKFQIHKHTSQLQKLHFTGSFDSNGVV